MISRKVKTSIAQEMEKSGLEARYDNNAKELIAHKIILAHILVATMEEYKGLDPKDVIPLIEGDPQVFRESKARRKKNKTKFLGKTRAAVKTENLLRVIMTI